MTKEYNAPERLERSIPPATFQKPVNPAPANGSGTSKTPLPAPVTQTTQKTTAEARPAEAGMTDGK